MNGRKLADDARTQPPALNVLFITSYAENGILNHGHLGRGMQVMTKPFVTEVHARHVKQLIANE